MVLYARVGADSGPSRGVPNVDSQWHSDRDFGAQVALSYDHLYICLSYSSPKLIKSHMYISYFFIPPQGLNREYTGKSALFAIFEKNKNVIWKSWRRQ